MATYTILEDVTWSGVWNDLDITLNATHIVTAMVAGG